MIVRIDVRIESDPNDQQRGMGWGQMNFSEQASLNDSSFETVSKVFTRCHELLSALKEEHRKK